MSKNKQEKEMEMQDQNDVSLNQQQNKGPQIDPQVMFEMNAQKEMDLLIARSEIKKLMQIANELQKQNNALQEEIKKLTEENIKLKNKKAGKSKVNPSKKQKKK